MLAAEPFKAVEWRPSLCWAGRNQGSALTAARTPDRVPCNRADGKLSL